MSAARWQQLLLEPAGLTDDNAAVTDSYAITPYGESVSRTGTTNNPFTWLGEYGVMQEGATSLYYMRARYYDGATARFVSPDPIVSLHPLLMNPYQYAAGNPVSNIDPAGLMPTGRDGSACQESSPYEKPA